MHCSHRRFLVAGVLSAVASAIAFAGAVSASRGGFALTSPHSATVAADWPSEAAHVWQYPLNSSSSFCGLPSAGVNPSPWNRKKHAKCCLFEQPGLFQQSHNLFKH